MAYLAFLSIGFGIIWLSRKTKDEIVLITAAISAAIFLIWGFAIAPLPLQMLSEMAGIMSVFSICVRCCRVF
ncbi:MAG TPA: hypothetical protein V6C65_03735 [Allocoleopsis sp.]